MDITQYLLDILKLIIAGLAVFFCAYYIVKSHFDNYAALKELELRNSVSKEILPLRLQAHERMALFLERINPSNMLLRLHVNGLSASEMHQLITNEVKAEFQHNLSQQIYLSNNAWQIIRRVKDDTLSLVNNAYAGIGENARGVELSKTILNHLSGIEENPYDMALMVVKQDIQQL